MTTSRVEEERGNKELREIKEERFSKEGAKQNTALYFVGNLVSNR